MRQAVLINGVPASGKSTVSSALVPMLQRAGLQLVPLGLDTVKEALFAEIGTGDREYNRMLGRASYHAIFNAVAEFPETLVPVIDAWHGFQPRNVLEGHLARARIDRVVEIWVSVTPEIAARRYRARSVDRHAGHLPLSYADELSELVRRAGPMGFGDVITVDSEAPLPENLADKIATLLSR